MAFSIGGVDVKVSRCPDTSRYGLLSAVEASSGVDLHWQSSGIEWEDFLCSPGLVSIIDECPPVTGYTKPIDRSTQFCHADPFVLLGSYQCPPVGRPADEAFEIARQRLLKWEGRQLESTLWTGEVANGGGFVNPSFAYGNSECDIEPVDLSPAGALDPVGAIALLEEALGDMVGCGVIHAPYGLAAYLQTLDLLERQGDKYFTPTGFQVIFGHGYPGSGPGNAPADAGETWLFGTGPLVMVRSNLMQIPENIQEGMNRMINDVEVRAERFYAVGFSCALYAVRSALTWCCA